MIRFNSSDRQQQR